MIPTTDRSYKVYLMEARPLSINALQYSTFIVEEAQGHVQGRALSVFLKIDKTKNYAAMMATSSLLLLRRCLWYRHTRRPTSSPMILLCYSGRRFVTSIVVGSQGYFEYGAPADEIKIYYSVYVHRIITIRMQWRCHHRLWLIYISSRKIITTCTNEQHSMFYILTVVNWWP